MANSAPTRNSFLKDELRNIMIALHTATLSAFEYRQLRVDESYIAGYRDALTAMALALGLEPNNSVRVIPTAFLRGQNEREGGRVLLEEDF